MGGTAGGPSLGRLRAVRPDAAAQAHWDQCCPFNSIPRGRASKQARPGLRSRYPCCLLCRAAVWAPRRTTFTCTSTTCRQSCWPSACQASPRPPQSLRVSAEGLLGLWAVRLPVAGRHWQRRGAAGCPCLVAHRQRAAAAQGPAVALAVLPPVQRVIPKLTAGGGCAWASTHTSPPAVILGTTRSTCGRVEWGGASTRLGLA